MKRVYSVKINGRTLESGNLKELLARAVNVKRNPDRGIALQTRLYNKISTEDMSRNYGQSEMVSVH